MAVRRAAQQSVTFVALDSSARPARKTGASLTAYVSKDGGAFAASTNAVTEIGATGRYALTLTAAEMDASWVHVYAEGAGVDPVDVTIGTSGAPSSSVAADGGNTASTFKTSLTESTTDHWKDALLLFTSGALTGQVKKISGYDGTTKFVTLSSAFTAAPSAADRFVLVNF